jgi:hypothetical protein
MSGGLQGSAPTRSNRGVDNRILLLALGRPKDIMTTSIRRVVVALLCIACYPSLLGAQRRHDYRTYRMGDDPVSIARQVNLPSPAAAASPVLGAVVGLTWRAQYSRRGGTPSSDPVALLVFSFYEDQLFRIVIDYSSDRTEGMTEADMVAAVSRVYGPPAKRSDPPNTVGLHPQRPADSVVAQWTDGELRVALLAVGAQTPFRLIVASVPLEALARGTGAHETPADLQDGPSINAARATAGVEKAGPAWEKRRRANIASFIP